MCFFLGIRYWIDCNTIECFLPQLFIIFIIYKLCLETLSFVIIIGNSYFQNVNRRKHWQHRKEWKSVLFPSYFLFSHEPSSHDSSWLSSSGHSGLMAHSPSLPQHLCSHLWHCLALWGGGIMCWCSFIQFGFIRSLEAGPPGHPCVPSPTASSPHTQTSGLF